MKFFQSLLAALTVILVQLATPAGAKNAAVDMELWRLDCGQIAIRNIDLFSDSFAYGGRPMTLTDSCYLIRHGKDYMLWDTGLPKKLIETPASSADAIVPSLDRTIVDQLRQIGVAPQKITKVGISHYHFDHMGQAADFPSAKLLIGALDWAPLRAGEQPYGVEPGLAANWLASKNVEAVTGDHDVFGDGSVIMLAMPGHTPGSSGLLVRLPATGAILLSGDIVHFREQLLHDGVPPFNTSRAQSLASLDRLKKIAAALNATLIIQHDQRDIARLPAFPQSAR